MNTGSAATSRTRSRYLSAMAMIESLSVKRAHEVLAPHPTSGTLRGDRRAANPSVCGFERGSHGGSPAQLRLGPQADRPGEEHVVAVVGASAHDPLIGVVSEPAGRDVRGRERRVARRHVVVGVVPLVDRGVVLPGVAASEDVVALVARGSGVAEGAGAHVRTSRYALVGGLEVKGPDALWRQVPGDDAAIGDLGRPH